MREGEVEEVGMDGDRGFGIEILWRVEADLGGGGGGRREGREGDERGDDGGCVEVEVGVKAGEF